MSDGGAFRSLRHRDFRVFFLTQSLSLTGSWMQWLAQSWLVYRITKDPFQLGLAGFLGQIPVLLLGLYAGVVTERVDRRRILLVTQALAALAAATLAVLTLTDRVALWQVYALAFFMGVVVAFDMPARQVLIGEIVPAAERHNAIALNSTIVNAARIVGPAVAGPLIKLWGEGVCFAVNATTYLAPIGAMLVIRGTAPARARPMRSDLEEIRGGLAYVWNHRAIRVTLLMLGLISACGVQFMVLLPIFAEDILASGSVGMGFLMGAAGAGATAGCLALAARPVAAGLDRLIIRTMIGSGACLAAFSFSRSLWLSCSILVFVGMAMMVQLSGINALLQDLSDDAYRGRVMGYYSLMFLGIMPVGNLAAGALASRIGAPWTVALGGVVCALAALRWSRNFHLLVHRSRLRSVGVGAGVGGTWA